MTSPIYRQADSRWGSLPYPSKPYTLARSGCGCCAVTHLVMEQPKYATYTPKNVRPVMVPYATRGHGTKWVGETAGLKHYGYTVKEFDSMSKLWVELNKGDRMGIILFRAGTRSGIRWTDGGHYVAFTQYREANGKHYFKTKDSGGRHHDGWYCYETQMKGLIVHIWTVKRKQYDVNNKSYKKEFPEHTIRNGDKGEDVRRWQNFLNHVFGNVLKVDGKFGLKTDAWTGVFQIYCRITEDSVVGRNTLLHARRWEK